MERKTVFENRDGIKSVITKLTELVLTREYVFRGYSDESQMMPTIIRKNDYSDVEGLLLQDFERYGSRYYNVSTPMDFLSCAQHFGLPTRLLDFTYNPFIAMSFALHDQKDNEGDNYYYIRYASIKDNLITANIPVPEPSYTTEMNATDSYAERTLRAIRKAEYAFLNNNEDKYYKYYEVHSLGIKPNGTNYDYEKQKVKDKNILFIDPYQSNQRVVMQQGLFMLPYTLNKAEHTEIISRCTSLMLIHKDLRTELLNYLDIMGYNTFRLMPDLSSICEAVKRIILAEKEAGKLDSRRVLYGDIMAFQEKPNEG